MSRPVDYPVDDLTRAERERIAPHFTDLTGRCSRSSTCRRRSRARCSPATRATPARCGGCSSTSSPTRCPRARAFDGDEGRRAAELYERIFVGYGDDSVAQLGGAHVACEWTSNILTKILQRPRLGAYLEQSTRYIAYDAPMPGGGYRYYRDAELGPEYEAAMDALFGAYAEALPRVRAWVDGDVPAHGRRVRRPRAAGARQREGVRPAARAAARGVAVPHGHLRDGPGVRAADPAPDRPPAAGGAPLRRGHPRRDQGRDAELRRARRAARTAAAPGPRSCSSAARPPSTGPRAWAWTASPSPTSARRCGCCTPTATRTGCSPRCCSSPPARREDDTLAAVARLGDDERERDARRPRRRAREPPPPSRPRLRGAALPLRGRLRLRRLPRPPAPPDADRAVAGAHARPRRRRARRGRRGRLRRPLPRRARALARGVRPPAPAPATPRRRRTRSASATGCATCWT